MPWSFDNSIPIYLQLAERIKLLIISGKLRSGDKLGSVRDLAQETGVNPNTMQRALTELEREGLIYSVRTCGRFISKDEELIKSKKERVAKDKTDELFATLADLGFTHEEILKAVADKLNETKRGE